MLTENIISKDIWQFIEEDLNRIFDCLRCSKDFENCYELAIEVRSDLDLLKSVCERFDQVKLFVERSRMEEEQVAQLKGLISKLEEECELLELSEKIKELEQRKRKIEDAMTMVKSEFEKGKISDGVMKKMLIDYQKQLIEVEIELKHASC